MAEWNGCYCGEFSQPTIAPDEFGETCFHEHDKCEVPTTKVPDQTVIRLLKQKVDALTERAEKAEAARDRLANQLLNEVPDSYIQMKSRALDAEAAIKRVRELHGRHDPNCPYGEDCAGAGLCLACREEYPCTTIRALERDNDDE